MRNSQVVIIAVLIFTSTFMGSFSFAGAVVSQCNSKQLPKPTDVWTAICDLQSQITSLSTALNSEISSRQSGDTNLQYQVSSLSTLLTSETTSRQSEDANLRNSINSIQLTPGPQGPQGDQGPQGIQGLKGDTSTVSLSTKTTTVTKPVGLITFDVDVTVTCDSGSYIVGGGHDIVISSGNSGSSLRYDGPSGNGWRVYVANTYSNSATIYAICITP